MLWRPHDDPAKLAMPGHRVGQVSTVCITGGYHTQFTGGAAHMMRPHLLRAQGDGAGADIRKGNVKANPAADPRCGSSPA